MLIMLKWWLVAALAQGGRAAVLLPRGLGREPRALFTDYVTIDVTLDAGERAALLYANGSLVMELPAKRWAWEASPPCEPGTAARVASANVPVATGRHALQVAAVACDGAVGPLGPAQVVETVADARHLPACANVTGEEVRVVDAFVYSDERDHAATRRAELAGEVAAHVAVSADRTFRGAPRDVDTPTPGVVGHIVATGRAGGGRGRARTPTFSRGRARSATASRRPAHGERSHGYAPTTSCSSRTRTRSPRGARSGGCGARGRVRPARARPKVGAGRPRAGDEPPPHALAADPAGAVVVGVRRRARATSTKGSGRTRAASRRCSPRTSSRGGAPKTCSSGPTRPRFWIRAWSTSSGRTLLKAAGTSRTSARAVPLGAGEAGRVAAVVADLRRKIGTFAHAAWAATILGRRRADDSQLAADARRGARPHEIELRCREAARQRRAVANTSRAPSYHAPTAAVRRAIAGAVRARRTTGRRPPRVRVPRRAGTRSAARGCRDRLGLRDGARTRRRLVAAPSRGGAHCLRRHPAKPRRDVRGRRPAAAAARPIGDSRGPRAGVPRTSRNGARRRRRPRRPRRGHVAGRAPMRWKRGPGPRRTARARSRPRRGAAGRGRGRGAVDGAAGRAGALRRDGEYHLRLCARRRAAGPRAGRGPLRGGGL